MITQEQATIYITEYVGVRRRFLTKWGAKKWLARAIATKVVGEDLYPDEEFVQDVLYNLRMHGELGAEVWAEQHWEDEKYRHYERRSSSDY